MLDIWLISGCWPIAIAIGPSNLDMESQNEWMKGLINELMNECMHKRTHA